MEVDEIALEESESSTTLVTSLEHQVSNVQENPGNFTDIQNNVGVLAVKLDPINNNSITLVNVLPEGQDGNEIEYADLSKNNTQLYSYEKVVKNSVSSIFVPTGILDLALEGKSIRLSLFCGNNVQ